MNKLILSALILLLMIPMVSPKTITTTLEIKPVVIILETGECYKTCCVFETKTEKVLRCEE